MKYEAKNNGLGVAVSQAAGNPYASINIGDSQTKCRAIVEFLNTSQNRFPTLVH